MCCVTLALLLLASGTGEPTLTLPGVPPGPGTVHLEVAPLEPGDPKDAVRLNAVLTGPLDGGEEAADLFALNAVLMFPAQRLAYVPGSVRKGELLERDGRSSLITAGGKASGETMRLTVGATRLGAVPGVRAPAGRTVLFSLALQVLVPGDVSLSWDEATFISSKVRPVAGARFLGAIFHAPAAGKDEP